MSITTLLKIHLNVARWISKRAREWGSDLPQNVHRSLPSNNQHSQSNKSLEEQSTELLEDLFLNPPVSPSTAGFNGEYDFSGGPRRYKVKFKRGTHVPDIGNHPHLKNQLLWVCPPGEEPMFMWMDKDGNLYHLKFHPFK